MNDVPMGVGVGSFGKPPQMNLIAQDKTKRQTVAMGGKKRKEAEKGKKQDTRGQEAVQEAERQPRGAEPLTEDASAVLLLSQSLAHLLLLCYPESQNLQKQT